MYVMRGRPEIAAQHRAGHVARCTVERLMRGMGISGIRRAKSPKTTRSAPKDSCPMDLVNRHFAAFAPNTLWVADITYVRTYSGWVYVAFVTDVYSRRIVGWQTSTSLYTDLALDALKMVIWRRRCDGAELSGLVHHSDRGVQYRAIRYGQALDDCQAVASVGTKGDSCDNALAEALNSLYKAELIRNRGPWASIDDVEIATAEWVHWSSTVRPTRRSTCTPPSNTRTRTPLQPANPLSPAPTTQQALQPDDTPSTKPGA